MTTLQEIQTKYEEALARIQQLERENARLKEVLLEHRIAVDEKEAAPTAAPRNRLTAAALAAATSKSAGNRLTSLKTISHV